jgi:large subunit ribosomal protein L23
MAITDIFKKEEKREVKGAVQKTDKRVGTAKTGGEAKAVRKISGQTSRILEHAHVTEKASNSAEKYNQYVFKVAKVANKIEIARAVESYYQVDVVAVNTVNVPAKRKRRGRGIAVEPGYRKAVVTIKKGQSIEILPQ